MGGSHGAKAQPPKPAVANLEEGIIKGIYKPQRSTSEGVESCSRGFPTLMG